LHYKFKLTLWRKEEDSHNKNQVAMAHYHKSRNQQQKKWERFKQRYGMSPAEWRVFKKTDPSGAEKLRQLAYQRFVATL